MPQYVSGNAWSIFGYVVGAGLLGGVYRSVELHLDHRGNTDHLDPFPEAISEDDPQLFQLLVQLQQYRNISRKRFIAIVVNANRLVKLLRGMKAPNADNTPTDLDWGQVYFEKAKSSLEGLIDKGVKDERIKPQHAVSAQKLGPPIKERLKAHWIGVQNLVDRI